MAELKKFAMLEFLCCGEFVKNLLGVKPKPPTVFTN